MTTTIPRSRQVIVGGIIIKRGGQIIIVATTPRQLRLARYLVRGE